MTDTAPAIELPAMPPPPEHTPGRRRLPTMAEHNILVTIANTLTRSGLKDSHNEATLYAKLLVGWEHGLDPGVSVNEIALTEGGRLALPEMVAVAAIRGSGRGDIRTVEVASDHATVEVTRTDWPAGKTVLVTYTAQDAITAGLLVLDATGKNVSKKENWRKNAPSMFLARARGNAKRQYFEEEAAGLSYSPDELSADDGDDVEPIALNHTPPPGFTPAIVPPPVGVAGDFAAPAGEPTPPPTPPGFRAPKLKAAPVETLAVATPAPLPNAGPPPATMTSPADPLLAQAVRCVKALGITQPQWQALVQHIAGNGVTTLAGLDTAGRQRVVDHVVNLWRIDNLRNLANLPDTAWTAALAKRGVSQMIDLKPEDAQAICDKLATLVTPFDLARLDIRPPGAATLAGKASSPSPSVPAAA